MPKNVDAKAASNPFFNFILQTYFSTFYGSLAELWHFPQSPLWLSEPNTEISHKLSKNHIKRPDRKLSEFRTNSCLLNFSTKENKTDFHFVYYLPASLKPIEKTLCLMAGVRGGEFFFRCEFFSGWFLDSYFYHSIIQKGGRRIPFSIWILLCKFGWFF